jgi:LacI family transcriptional regulator
VSADKTPTVYDVASRAGVSIATVSFTFRRPERVRPATRAAVLAAASELGYVPNASARGLADGRTGALGLYAYDFLLDAAENVNGAGATNGGAGGDAADDIDAATFPLYVDEVQRGVELQCWQRGYALMLGGGSRTSGDTVVTDIAGRVDGLAVFPQTVPPDVLDRIAGRIPVVEVSHAPRDDGLHHVTVDNAGGMRELTRHLIREHGLRDLLFVGAVDSADAAARHRGFRAELRAAGLGRARPAFAHEEGARAQARALIELLSRSDRPEGVVCATDLDAIAVLDAVAQAGLKVPRDLAVTGFDGILAGRIANPPLTTVRQPMEQLGRAVVDVLVEHVGRPRAEPVSIQLPVRLLIRRSCGCSGR